jgi:hypothetical protein
MRSEVFTGFMVHCQDCGHHSTPARSLKEGMRRILAGEFTSCRGCGKEFAEIHVPDRPLVRQIQTELGRVSQIVRIVDHIPGTMPARGFIS